MILGLDGSGKTSILYKLILDENIESIPTIDFNMEILRRDNTNITIRDIAGREQFRLIWRNKYANT